LERFKDYCDEKRKEKPKRPGNKRLKEKLDRDQLYMGESFNSREREGGPLEIDTHTHKTTTSSQWSRVHNGRRMRHAPKAAAAANPNGFIIQRSQQSGVHLLNGGGRNLNWANNNSRRTRQLYKTKVKQITHFFISFSI
jgi:hypothetical protein